jgi:hypothetical protein
VAARRCHRGSSGLLNREYGPGRPGPRHPSRMMLSPRMTAGIEPEPEAWAGVPVFPAAACLGPDLLPGPVTVTGPIRLDALQHGLDDCRWRSPRRRDRNRAAAARAGPMRLGRVGLPAVVTVGVAKRRGLRSVQNTSSETWSRRTSSETWSRRRWRPRLATVTDQEGVRRRPSSLAHAISPPPLWSTLSSHARSMRSESVPGSGCTAARSLHCLPHLA